jgi:hypothetical protein
MLYHVPVKKQYGRCALLIQRMIRAARLDSKLYEEVEADPSTLKQAILVVVLSSVAAGIGTAAQGIAGIIAGAIGALIGWFVWALVTYFVGTRILSTPETKSNLGELLRTIGFSSAPGILRLLGIISPLRGVVFLISGIWMLSAMVVAVRQALDYKSTGRAIAVVFIGWLFMIIISLAVIFLASAGGGGGEAVIPPVPVN